MNEIKGRMMKSQTEWIRGERVSVFAGVPAGRGVFVVGENTPGQHRDTMPYRYPPSRRGKMLSPVTRRGGAGPRAMAAASTKRKNTLSPIFPYRYILLCQNK